MKLRKEGRPLPCCPLPSTWVSPRDLGARRLPPLLCSAWFSAVLLCSALVLYSVLESCPEKCFSWSSRRSEQRLWRAEQSSGRAEYSWSDTTPGLLYHMTAVGLKSVPRNSPNTKQRQVQRKLCWISPHWWEWTTAHQEEERCIEWKLTMQSTQCNAAQRNVMQCTPPPGVLVPFTVFLQCISSLNPKISSRMLPITAKLLVPYWEYVPLALLPETSFSFQGFCYRHY